MNLYGWICVVFVSFIFNKTCSSSGQQSWTLFSKNEVFAGKNCEIYDIAIQAENVLDAIVCGHICQGKGHCKSYFYKPDTRQCFGCSIRYGVNNSTITSHALDGSDYYVMNEKYMGCYKEWRTYMSGGLNQTIATCFDYCSSVRMEYIGIWRDFCGCHDTIYESDRLEENMCNQPCLWDVNKRCGGNNGTSSLMSIYK